MSGNEGSAAIAPFWLCCETPFTYRDEETGKIMCSACRKESVPNPANPYAAALLTDGQST